VFAALLCTLLFSLSAICGHRSARRLGGTEANFWRVATATGLLSLWAYGPGRGMEGSAFPLFLVSGMIGVGIGDVAYFQALPRLGPRLAVLLVHCLGAPFGALIEWLWLGTRLTSAQMAWGVIALAGVAIALSPTEHVQRSRSTLVRGILFSALAALGGSSGAVLSRKAYEVVRASGPPLDGATAAFQRVVGGLLVSGAALLVVKWGAFRAASISDPPVSWTQTRAKWRGVWPWVLANALAGQTIGVSCMQWALETTPSGIVLAIIAITPVVVIPFAMAFEGEKPGLRSVAGGAVAVTGVIGLALSH
jgi:drug/metabolite transporter (DMT)-like permease